MIIPLKDSIPALHKPYASWLIIIASLGVFLYQKFGLSLPEARVFIRAHGLTPAALPFPGLPDLVSYMFLHGGWLHLIGNLWIFRIFSDNIEDVMGPVRFFLFYLACGVVAGLAHSFVHPESVNPVIGGSGAISGVLGAYFLLYPRARVTTFVMLLILDLPAVLYLGGWFLLQLYSGLSASGSSGIAWWAHLGGFVAGMLLFPFFRSNRCWTGQLPQPPEPRYVPDPKDPWARLRSK